MTKSQVVVIGSGPAGLTAAYELVKQGFKPIVLEKADKVGGISRTETYKGYPLILADIVFTPKLKKYNNCGKRFWEMNL